MDPGPWTLDPGPWTLDIFATQIYFRHNYKIMDSRDESSYELSKVRLLGVGFNLRKEWSLVPECVLIDLATSAGVRVTTDQIKTHSEHIIGLIENTSNVPRWKRSDALDMSTLQTLAGYVNSDAEVRWTSGPLLAATEHLLQYYDHNSIIPLSPGFVVGNKTPSVPLAYDASLLYIHCRHHLLHVSRATSMDDMANMLRLIHLPDMVLRSGVYQRIQSLSRADMIQMITTLSIEGPEAKAIDFEDPCSILRRVVPISGGEAIALAARAFDRNITESRYPIDEYLALVSGQPAVDPEYRKRYARNPIWYNVRLTWDPAFGSLYEPCQIRRFLTIEGYEGGGEQSLYQARYSLNIYPGRHPHCESTETSIDVTGIDVLPASQYISIGVYGTETWHLYHFAEIGEYFERQMDFCDPANSKQRLSHTCINKLYGFAPLRLKQIIDRIHIHHNGLNACYNAIKAIDTGGYAKTLEPLIETLRSGDSERVCESVRQYNAYMKSVRESVKSVLVTIPLVTVRRVASTVDPVYVADVDPDHGTTIHGLVSLLHTGSMAGCMRDVADRLERTVLYFMKKV